MKNEKNNFNLEARTEEASTETKKTFRKKLFENTFRESVPNIYMPIKEQPAEEKNFDYSRIERRTANAYDVGRGKQNEKVNYYVNKERTTEAHNLLERPVKLRDSDSLNFFEDRRTEAIRIKSEVTEYNIKHNSEDYGFTRYRERKAEEMKPKRRVDL